MVSSRRAAKPSPPSPSHAFIEQWMAAARPRLLHLARSNGFADEAADEIAQETLLEAWRHLDALTRPDGFQAWLSAICRNVCRRHRRAYHLLAQREIPLGNFMMSEDDESVGEVFSHEFPDPLAIDPAEELERHDRATMLDSALGYLSAPSREAMELCYLTELPQREAAQRLGLTIAALEARLHRARRQLRQVLSSELRAQAGVFGLAFDEDDNARTAGWRETRLWCLACGQHRMRGVFEPLAERQVNLRLRCPGCGDELNSWGHVPLEGIRSFRPAYKRVMHALSAYFLPGLASGWLTCPACGSPQPVRLAAAEDMPGAHHAFRKKPGLMVTSPCQACGRHHADVPVASLLWLQPVVQRFLDAHPHAVMEPETYVEYLGQPAIRARLAAIASAARLTILAHPETLRVLTSFQE
jgi:RNA polymerase sigma factor (sigma-70 family)